MCDYVWTNALNDVRDIAETATLSLARPALFTNFAETAAPFAWPTSLSVFDGAHVVEVGSH
jgi:hypothetical protein